MQYEQSFSFSQSGSRLLPFNQRLRDFLAESRKRHTLYANCEGSYSRRVVKKEEEDLLKNYVYNTLYYEEGSSWLAETNGQKVHTVDSIKDKMCRMSKRYMHDDEVHYTTIWVYYFDYKQEKGKCTPVFKVYKTKSRDDAVYLDMELREYESWDNYLENASFPESFVCFPRHGVYHFDDEENKLDLDFFSCGYVPRRVGTYYNDSSIAPFCLRAVHPLIIKLKSFSASVKEKFYAVVVVLQDLWAKHKGTIFKGIILLVSVVKTILQGNFTCVSAISDTATLGLMLMNSSNSEVLTNRKIVESITAGTPLNKLSNLSVTMIQEVSNDRYEFIKLLKHPLKNWREILRCFCRLFVKCRPVLLATLSAFGCQPVALVVVSSLLLGAEMLERSSFLNPSKELDQQGIGGNDLPSLTDKPHGERSLPVVPLTTEEQPPSYSSLNGERISIDSLMSNLNELEERSMSSIAEKMVVDGGATEKSLNPSSVVKTLAVQDVDEFRMYFMPNATVPQLTHDIHRLLGTNMKLQLTEALLLEVVDPSGDIVGHVYFPKESTAIGLFRRDRISDKTASEVKIIEAE